MEHLKKTFVLVMLLTAIVGSRTFAQDFKLEAILDEKARDRAKEVIQDNEYISTGYEQGKFFDNPLLINGKLLNYSDFSKASKGELTVIKGSPITGEPMQVPFYAYLRRNGMKVLIFGRANPYQSQTKIDISEILSNAKPGDQLVIEAVRREDGPVKRILKLRGGC